MTTRRKILDELLASLAPIYGDREAKSISEIVVESLFGWTRIDCVLNADHALELSCEQQQRLEKSCGELMLSRPVQYVLGECEFCGLTLGVREGVLIPRSETEELVAWICSLHSGGQMLDIGTGSGAIAISLAHTLGSMATVYAIDVSDSAIEIATENAKRSGVDVKFSKIDILEPRQQWLAATKYDVIVSNPPYIPDSDRAAMHENVLNYEPHIALFVNDNDPLIFYRAIAHVGLSLLNSSGWLYFEIYEKLGSELNELLSGMGYVNVELRVDINEKPRMIRCQKSF